MARGRKTELVILLSPKERQELEYWQRPTTMPVGLVRRARVILLLADHHAISDVARMMGMSRRFVYRWSERFLARRIDGLADKTGRGRKAFFSPGGCCVSCETGLRTA